MIEETKRMPERYIWRGGRPVFDIVKELLLRQKNTEPAIEERLRECIGNSGIQDFVNEIEKSKFQKDELQIKIDAWTLQKKELETSCSGFTDRLLDEILTGDPEGISEDHGAKLKKIDDLSIWIDTSKSIIIDIDKKIEILRGQIRSAFKPIIVDFERVLQKNIDEHMSEIYRIDFEHRQALQKIASDVGFSLPANILSGLKLFDVPQSMLASHWQNVHKGKN